MLRADKHEHLKVAERGVDPQTFGLCVSPAPLRWLLVHQSEIDQQLPRMGGIRTALR